MKLQDQIYVVVGVGAGLLLFLFILICILFSKVAKLKKLVRGEYAAAEAYYRQDKMQSDLLERRGFNEYKGPPVVKAIQPQNKPSPPTIPAPTPQGTGQVPVAQNYAPSQTGSYAINSSPVIRSTPSIPPPLPSTNYGGRGYDNSAYERDPRDNNVLSTGVRVLPNTAIDHSRRTGNIHY